jgi:hypothetical protein
MRKGLLNIDVKVFELCPALKDEEGGFSVCV